MTNPDTTQPEQDTTPKPEDGTPKAEGTPPEQKEPSPKEEPKTLTIPEAEKLAQLARMDAGRAQKAAEIERDTAQTALAVKEVELTDIAEEREKLNTQIDELSSNDPAKFNIIKKDRELLLRENTLKTNIRAEEAKWKVNEDRVKAAEDTNREITIWEIATTHEGGDPVKLKDLCETFGANTEEEIVKVAGTLWAKKTASPNAPKTQPLKPFSGRTTGGVLDIDGLSAKEKIEEGLKEKTK